MGEMEKNTWVSEMRGNHIRINTFFYLVQLYLFAYSRRVHWPQPGGLFQGIGIHWWSVGEGATFREREREGGREHHDGGGHLNQPKNSEELLVTVVEI